MGRKRVELWMASSKSGDLKVGVTSGLMSFQDKSRCFDEVQEENFILSCIKSAAAEVDLKLFRFNFTFPSKLPSKQFALSVFLGKSSINQFVLTKYQEVIQTNCSAVIRKFMLLHEVVFRRKTAYKFLAIQSTTKTKRNSTAQSVAVA